MHNDLKIELMQWQWQAYRVRGSSFDNKKNIPSQPPHLLRPLFIRDRIVKAVNWFRKKAS